jgi:hypothetical protein
VTDVRIRPALRISADLVITVVLVVLFAAALLTTTGWPFRTALFPMIVSGAALLLSLGYLGTLLLRRSEPRSTGEADPPDETDESDEDAITIEAEEAEEDADYVFATAGRSAWAATLAWFVAFFAALYVLGLLIAAPLFSFCYLRFSARRSWLSSLVYALVVLVAVYLAFESLLTIPIPPALWQQS